MSLIEVQVVPDQELPLRKALVAGGPVPDLCLNVRIGDHVYRVIGRVVMHRELSDVSRELAFVL